LQIIGTAIPNEQEPEDTFMQATCKLAEYDDAGI